MAAKALGKDVEAATASLVDVFASLIECAAPLPFADFDAWLAAEDGPSLFGGCVDEEGGGGAPAVPPVSPLSAPLCAAVAAWERATGGAASGPSAPAQAALWEGVAGLGAGSWARGVLMLLQGHVLRLLSAPPCAPTVESAAAVEGLAAVAAYWALLRLPGAQAFGLFHAGLLRRTVAASKLWLELCAVSAPGEGGGGGGGGGVAAPAAPRRAAAPPPPAPARAAHPRRAAAAAAAAKAGGEDAGGGSEDSGAEEEEGEEEEEEEGGGGAAGRKRRPRAAAGRAKRSRGGGGGGGGDASRLVFPPSALATLAPLLRNLAALLTALPLRTHQELLPFFAELIVLPVSLPLHAAAARLPAGARPGGYAAEESAHPLRLAAHALLALLSPRHAAPLTTARVLLKRLKTPLLWGSLRGGPGGGGGGGGGAPPAAAAAFGDDAEVRAAAAAAGALPPPLAPPDAKTVRARALYLVQALAADDVGGAAAAAAAVAARAGAGEGGDGVAPIPAPVLQRLPAVAALLQHLLAGAAGCGKADARAAVCAAVAEVRAALPHSLRRAVVRFVARGLAASPRVALRAVAVEVAAAMLGLGDGGEEGGGGEPQAGGEGVHAGVVGEFAVPSAADAALEAAGYGAEGAAYAGDAVTGDAAAAAGAAAGDDDDAAATASARTASASIELMGEANAAGTPARKAAAAAAAAPELPGSPFYGSLPGRAAAAGGGGGALATAPPAKRAGGCVEPKPTVTLLLELLLARAGDRSPAVRARALGALAAALDTAVTAQARAYALLLAHSVGGGGGGGGGGGAPLAASPLLPMLLRRLGDAKAGVRRSAVAAVAAVAVGGAGGDGGALPPALAAAAPGEVTPEGGAEAWAAAEGAHRAALFAALGAAPAHGGGAPAPRAAAARPAALLGAWGLHALIGAATDGSSLVRRAVVAALARLRAADPGCPHLQAAWLAAVLPAALDGEAVVAARGVEAAREAVISPVGGGGAAEAAAWALLDAAGRHPHLSRAVGAALGVTFWGSATPGAAAGAGAGAAGAAAPLAAFVAALQRACGAEGEGGAPQRRGAWLLLELLAGHLVGGPGGGGGGGAAAARLFAPVAPFLLRAWGALGSGALGEGGAHGGGGGGARVEDGARLLRIFSLVPLALPARDAAAVCGGLGGALAGCGWPPPLAGAGVRALAALSAAHALAAGGGGAGGGDAMEGAFAGVLGACGALLARAAAAGGRPAPEATAAALFTVGEVALIGLDADAGQGVGDKAGALAPRLLRLPPALAQLTQALLPAATPAGAPLGDATRAHAYAALGKLCLRDAPLAKRCLPMLLRDLRATGEEAAGPAPVPAPARNNILFTLADWCVRFTSLVEGHGGTLAGAVGDPEPAIRRHAILLLTQLVASDYLKWRGVFFYRFAAALADGDGGVRDAARGALTGALVARNRLLLQSHFVDLVFVLTGCTSHPAYAHLIRAGAGAARGGEDEEEEAAGGGGGGGGGGGAGAPAPAPAAEEMLMPDPHRRHAVYAALLDAMPEEQLFTVAGKLAVEVLGGLADGTLPLAGAGAGAGAPAPRTLRVAPAPLPAGEAPAASAAAPPHPTLDLPLGSSEALVAEVLALLSSPRMRAMARGGGGGSGGGGGGEGEAEGEGEGEGGGEAVVASLALAKSRLLAKLARKNVVENVVPICVALKALLSAKKSPLVGPLMAYLTTLFADYGSDVAGAWSFPPPTHTRAGPAQGQLVAPLQLLSRTHTRRPPLRRRALHGQANAVRAGVRLAAVRGGGDGHVWWRGSAARARRRAAARRPRARAGGGHARARARARGAAAHGRLGQPRGARPPLPHGEGRGRRRRRRRRRRRGRRAARAAALALHRRTGGAARGRGQGGEEARRRRPRRRRRRQRRGGRRRAHRARLHGAARARRGRRRAGRGVGPRGAAARRGGRGKRGRGGGHGQGQGAARGGGGGGGGRRFGGGARGAKRAQAGVNYGRSRRRGGERGWRGGGGRGLGREGWVG
jgi:hypothetical protein